MEKKKISPEARLGLVKEISDLINHEYKIGEGYLSDKEIAEIIEYNDQTVRNWIRKAISLGCLAQAIAETRSKENASKRGRCCYASQRTLSQNQELEVLMYYMYDNRTNDKIMNDLGISQKLYHSTIRRCVNYGLISQEEYETREFQRRSNGRKGKPGTLPVKITEEQKTRLKDLLEQGITYREIEKRLGINGVDYWAKRFGHKRSNKIKLTDEQKDILVIANQEGLDARQACEIIYDNITDNDTERIRRFWKKEGLTINPSDRYITKNIILQMCEAYDSGFNLTEISKLLDVSDNTISKCLRAEGYDTSIDLNESQIELALEAHKKSMTLKEASEFSGISETSIARIWKRNGLLPNHLGIFGSDSQCIAQDGHVCHSRAEKTIDDLFLQNSIPHEKPSNFTQNGTYYEDSSMTPDWIIDRRIYIEFAGLYNPSNNFPMIQSYNARVDQKMQELKRRNIPHVFIFPRDDLETKLTEIKSLIERYRGAA